MQVMLTVACSADHQQRTRTENNMRLMDIDKQFNCNNLKAVATDNTTNWNSAPILVGQQ